MSRVHNRNGARLVLRVVSAILNGTKSAQKIDRNAKGGMLILTSVSLILVSFLVVVGVSIGSLLVLKLKQQGQADRLALLATCRLNEEDRIGKMNNIVARTRQLVYSSRETYAALASDENASALAERMLNDSRQNARDIECNRLELVQKTESDAREAVELEHKNIRDSLSLPWLNLSQPVIKNIRFGKVKSVESNVVFLDKLEALRKLDLDQHVHKESGLYKGSQNLRLPSDGDLPFPISSLSANVDGITSFSRRIINETWIPEPQQQQLKSAVSLELTSELVCPLAGGQKLLLTSEGHAAASGAGTSF
jgi:hypothetical protein